MSSKLNVPHGWKIRIKTKKGFFEGMVIERPELLDDDVIVIKLKNGYNIGILKDDILDYEILEKNIKNETKSNFNKDLMKKREMIKRKNKDVSFISTGGTISSKVDYSTGGVSATYDANYFLELFPELNEIASLKPVGFMNKMSEDLLPEDWINIAKKVYEELKKSEGVVVTHGTDTMHYTSAALSFFIRNLNKPVVLTGSQRSVDRGSTDARLNLMCATYAALSDIAETGIVFHATSNDDYCFFHRGTKVRKMHTSRRDAFRSINAKPLAKIFGSGEIEYLVKNYNKRNNSQEPVLDARFEDKTAMLFVHPNMEPQLIDFLVEKDYKGIILQATALGHVPINSKKEIFSSIKRAIKDGVIIGIASQTLYGRVHESVYSGLRKLSKLGAIFLQDMIPEVAYVKLGWILAKTTDYEKVRKEMLTNYAGEFSYSNYRTFLN